MDSNQGKITKETAVFEVSSKPKKRLSVWVNFGTAAAIFIVAAGIGGYYSYRFISGNIEGQWTSKQLNEKMQDKFTKSYTNDGYSAYLPEDKSMLVDFKTTMTIAGNKARLNLAITYNREVFYKAYQSKAEDILDDYREAKDNVSDLVLTKEKYFDHFDRNIQERLPDSYDYDTKTGTVTYEAFEGTVNRIDRTITITKVSKDDTMALSEGEVIRYEASGSRFTLATYDKYEDIDFTKEQTRKKQ